MKMNYAFSPSGVEKLKRFARPGTLLAFDFDGTLAPIVAAPDSARLPPSTERLLRNLAGLAPVVLLSGRSRSDLRSRSPLPLRSLLGNHGAEGLISRGQRARAGKTVRGWKRELLRGLPPQSGMRLEDKKLSLSVHYRDCRKRAACRKSILAIAAGLKPSPRIVPGKCVVNLVPAELPHKGTALLALLNHSRLVRALYVGDDDTDEDVFSLKDPRICSLRVGCKAKSKASLYLRKQSEINHLLRFLLRRVLRARHGRGYASR